MRVSVDWRALSGQVATEDTVVRVQPVAWSIVDQDGDGISDCIEQSWGLDKTDANDGAADPDSDGLTSVFEILGGTHPFVADSDGDLVDDGAEIVQTSDPLHADSGNDFDGDGTASFYETLLGTSDADPNQIPESTRPLGAIQTLPQLSGATQVVWAIGNDGTRVSLSYTPGIGDRVHAFAATGELEFEVLVDSGLVRTANKDQSERRVLALTESGDVLAASNEPVWRVIQIDRDLGRISAQFQLPAHFEMAGNIVLDGDQLYLVGFDTRVHPSPATVFAFNLKDKGISRWQAPLDAKAYFLVGGIRGEIYAVQDNALVVAIDGETG